MRDSISTWRTGMSILAIRAWISSSLDGMSVTNSWLVRVSKTTLPRGDRMRVAVAAADRRSPPRALARSGPLAMSCALA